MISVCIPTYNGEKYIRRQLESILIQLGSEDEIIISDDSSTDDTVRIICELGDPRITLLEKQQFRSPIYNLENALRRAKGELIFLADQDDIWDERKVAVLSEHLKQYDLTVCDCTVVNDKMEVIHPSYFKLLHSGKGVWKNVYKNTYLGCCMAFNRKILMKALPFPPDIPMHDIWIGFVAGVCGKPVFVEDKLTLYRRHEDNASSTTQPSAYPLSQKLKFRWNLIKYLPHLLLKKAAR